MNKKKTVLIIDDNNDNLKVAASLLNKENLNILMVRTGDDGIKAAIVKKPDIILLDIQMPELDGFKVAEILKEEPVTKEIPIIFMTAKNDDESIERAFQYGAVDYIIKPVKKIDIISRVNIHLKMAEMIQELRLAVDTDGLTKLFNHRKIIEILNDEIRRAKRYKSNLSVLMMDIDFFKKVNDSYGHRFGDTVLEKISQCITETIRDTDLAGRYGGEEFLVVFPGVDEEEAKQGAERIRRNIEKVVFENGFHTSVSGGVIQFFDESAGELIEKADRRLYCAKNGGRNRIVGGE